MRIGQEVYIKLYKQYNCYNLRNLANILFFVLIFQILVHTFSRPVICNYGYDAYLRYQQQNYHEFHFSIFFQKYF